MMLSPEVTVFFEGMLAVLAEKAQVQCFCSSNCVLAPAEFTVRCLFPVP